MKIPILSPILFISLMLFACEDAETSDQKEEEIEKEVVVKHLKYHALKATIAVKRQLN